LTYTKPYPAVAAIAGHVAFYPNHVHITTTEEARSKIDKSV
jgi:uncharacterized protein (DUF427 family)